MKRYRVPESESPEAFGQEHGADAASGPGRPRRYPVVSGVDAILAFTPRGCVAAGPATTLVRPAASTRRYDRKRRSDRITLDHVDRRLDPDGPHESDVALRDESTSMSVITPAIPDGS